jgi:deoxyribodipyrimidine photo-lyase
MRRAIDDYGDRRDLLADDATSKLSAPLHFGCLSALEVVRDAESRPGAGAFVRQLCWRDFFGQILAARPDAAWSDFSPGDRAWRDDPAASAAWQEGRTGYPLVDAAMRQLACDGFVHNRARMVAASFLTKNLGVDWRVGARHFLDHLVDGDLASNNLSWQWVAGTGTGGNPHRVLNPARQARRFDPEGRYVRRHVAELAGVRSPAIFDPAPESRAAAGYPPPIVDPDEVTSGQRAGAAPARKR